MYASAERDIEAPQRGPQDADPPGQDIPSAVLNAMYESPELDAQGEADSSSRGGGIHEQEELPDDNAMRALYGIGVQLLARQGWQMHQRLGARRQGSQDGLLTPLINDREPSRHGLGWSQSRVDSVDSESTR